MVCYKRVYVAVLMVFVPKSTISLFFRRYWLYRTTRSASLTVYRRNRYDELRQSVIDSLFTDDEVIICPA